VNRQQVLDFVEKSFQSRRLCPAYLVLLGAHYPEVRLRRK
jgi:hypothetical protein